MPFTAKDRQTDAYIDITLFDDPRNQLCAGDMVCPVCGSQMIIRAGAIRAAHFAHRPDPERGCIYADYAAGETPEHREGKLFIRDWLRESFPGVEVQLEHAIRQDGQVIRIADVIQLFPRGWRIVYELQLASITTGTLSDRTRDYLACGCDVVWILGRDANTDINRRWCEREQGQSYVFTWAETGQAEEVYRRITENHHA